MREPNPFGRRTDQRGDQCNTITRATSGNDNTTITVNTVTINTVNINTIETSMLQERSGR